MPMMKISASSPPMGCTRQDAPGYFDLDWLNRHVVCTCAVSGLLAVYEVLVAQLDGPV